MCISPWFPQQFLPLCWPCTASLSYIFIAVSALAVKCQKHLQLATRQMQNANALTNVSRQMPDNDRPTEENTEIHQHTYIKNVRMYVLARRIRIVRQICITQVTGSQHNSSWVYNSSSCSSRGTHMTNQPTNWLTDWLTNWLSERIVMMIMTVPRGWWCSDIAWRLD